MFREFTLGLSVAAFFSATACGQQLALVQDVDLEQRQIVVKIGDVPWRVSADQVELRGQDGIPATLADFIPEEKVLVTRNGETVTRIQRADGARQLFARSATRGRIAGVDREHGTITLEIGDRRYTLEPAAVKLLDRDGRPLQSGDFATGEPVDVTFTREVPARIRKVNAR